MFSTVRTVSCGPPSAYAALSLIGWRPCSLPVTWSVCGGVSAYESRGRLTTLARSRSSEMCTIMIVSVQWQGAPPRRYWRRSAGVILSRPSVPTSRMFVPWPRRADGSSCP